MQSAYYAPNQQIAEMVAADVLDEKSCLKLQHPVTSRRPVVAGSADECS
jgi:hypothetical protein